jgi:MoxR-like ATPase
MTPSPLEPVLFEVKRTIVGQDVLLERMAIAMLAGGHLLVEGVPGLAKTLAVKSLAGAIGGQFQRIQFTPDLVPADLVGTRVYHQRTGEFEVSLGPVFTNLLLADEINRAPAKVQSALLEVMQERQVTIGRETFPVPEPFLVMATQNPIESDGTYPLPEAQVDRFMMKVLVSYPTSPEEHAIVGRALLPPGPPQVMLTPEDLIRMRDSVAQVYVDPAVVDYAVRLVAATRSPGGVGQGDLERYVTYGASPRATIALVLGGRACAAGTTCSPTTSTKWPSTYCATALCCRTRRWLTTSMPTASWSGCCVPCPCRTWCCSHDLGAGPSAAPAGVADRAATRRARPGRVSHPAARYWF